MKKVKGRTAQTIRKAIIDLLQPFMNQTDTITCDNGKEFTEHTVIAEALQAEVHRAYPQSACERGNNEYANGLIRQYFPKGTDFSPLTKQDIETAMLRLNYRPRKCLDFSSPYMVFFQNVNAALKT